jgi:hypothetical protein
LILRPVFTVENLHVGYTWPGWGEPARTFMNNDFLPRFNAMMKNYTYLHGTGFLLAPNGDLIFQPIVVKPGPIVISSNLTSEQEPPTSASQFSKDKRQPLLLRVRTAGEIRPLEETAFSAILKSNLSEDSEVEVTFDLPREVSLAVAEVVATDSGGERHLIPITEARGDGVTAITLRDRLAAGDETSYILRVLFQSGEDNSVLINTRVASAIKSTGSRVAPVHATTYFQFKSGAVRPEGTTVTRR